MSEYKGIKGFSIQSLSADPADPNIGQVWYNSTSGSWKVTSLTTAGFWATGNNMNTARYVCRKCRYSNSSFRFWWSMVLDLQQQLKNMMVTNWTSVNSTGLNTARAAFSRLQELKQLV
jgi:hypothetical protein